MRTAIHTLNWIFLGFACLTVFCAKHCYTLNDSPTVSAIISVKYVKWAIVLAVVCATVSFMIYAINIKKWKVYYFIMGSALLCVLFINSAFHFKIYRDTRHIKEQL